MIQKEGMHFATLCFEGLSFEETILLLSTLLKQLYFRTENLFNIPFIICVSFNKMKAAQMFK